MSLAVVGRAASYEFRWRRWALLRDTIAVIEPAIASECFRSIGDALVVGSLRIPASELAKEVREIKARLRGRPVAELMISPLTASVLYMGAKLTGSRALTAREQQQIAPPGEVTDLAEYFASMCDSLLDVCAEPFADDRVEVLDA